MSKRGVGVILHGGKDDPEITGYLIIGDKHYELYGHRVSKARIELHVRETGDERGDDSHQQRDLF